MKYNSIGFQNQIMAYTVFDTYHTSKQFYYDAICTICRSSVLSFHIDPQPCVTLCHHSLKIFWNFSCTLQPTVATQHGIMMLSGI